MVGLRRAITGSSWGQRRTASARIRRSVCETLESRTLLSVGMDANGWTTFTPSADTRIVYVSSSQGIDTNTGLSPTTPVASIPAAMKLLRPGMPDWVLFKRGDTWNQPVDLSWGGDGRSAAEPKLLGAYGSGPRPVLNSDGGGSGNQTGSGVFLLSGIRPIHAAIIGLDFECGPEANAAKSPTGLRFLSGAIQDVLVEDCVVKGFANGIVAQGYSGTLHNVSLRRNIIADNYSATAHAQGLYADNVDSLLLEGNVFDHNGWSEQVSVASPTIFNHNVYVKENVRGVLIQGNLFARASSHGLQARSGGIVRNNLFIDNPIGLSFGYVNGSPATSGGVEGEISGNVFLGGRDIGGSPRGWAIELSNTKPGSGVAIRDNLFAHEPQKMYSAIRLIYGSLTNPAEAVGINDMTIEGNTVYDWAGGIELSSKAQLGGSGQYALNNLSVTGNDFQVTQTLVQHAPPFNASQESWSANRYDTSASPWFTLQNTPTTWAAWHNSIDPTGSATHLAYPDPTRTLATYNASLGGAPLTEAFLNAARQQSAQNWLPQYSVAAAIDYMRQGFGMASLGGIHVTPTSAPITSESGQAATFQVALATAPLADVIVRATTSDPTEANLAAPLLRFTPANWNVPQTLTVAGIDDLLADGDVTYTLSFTMTSADPIYAGLCGPDIALTNVDNDAAAIILSRRSGLTTTETGGTASFDVRLASQPTADVVIAFTSTNPAQGIVSTPSLLFTPDTWNTPQTVLVAGQNNLTDDGDVAFAITSVASSDDPLYSGLRGEDALLTNVNDDSAAILLTPPAETITSKAGRSAMFTVQLRCQPAADVIVPLSVSNPAEASLSTTQLLFTPDNWNTPQSFRVTGLPDATLNGGVPYNVIVGAASSNDPAYNGLAAPPVAMTNLDTQFSAIPYFGDTLRYTPLTPSRWSVVADGRTARYFLNATDSAPQPAGRLGEYALVNRLTFGDFYFNLSARSAENPASDPSANYAVIFGFHDARNYSYLLMTPNARTTTLRTVRNGVAQTVAYATSPGFTDANYHNIEITRSGSTVRVLRDGIEILHGTNARLARPGRVGVGSLGTSAYFGDISVAPPSQPITAVLAAPAVLLNKQAATAPAAATAGTSKKRAMHREQYVFSVTYIPNTYPRNIRRISSGDVYVTDGQGFKQSAKLLARRPGPVSGSVIADYAITPPGGAWDAGDKGKYTICLAANHVSDANNHFAAAQRLGAFTVAFPAVATSRANLHALKSRV